MAAEEETPTTSGIIEREDPGGIRSKMPGPLAPVVKGEIPCEGVGTLEATPGKLEPRGNLRPVARVEFPVALSFSVKGNCDTGVLDDRRSIECVRPHDTVLD